MGMRRPGRLLRFDRSKLAGRGHGLLDECSGRCGYCSRLGGRNLSRRWYDILRCGNLNLGWRRRRYRLGTIPVRLRV